MLSICFSETLVRLLYLILLSLVIPLAAQARPNSEVTTEFYSDQAKSNLVGERILTCGGGVAKWGRQSGFSAKSSAPCGPGRRVGTSIAASSILHHDPRAACVARCNRMPLVNLGSCTSGDNRPCEQPRDICQQGCKEIMSTPE